MSCITKLPRFHLSLSASAWDPSSLSITWNLKCVKQKNKVESWWRVWGGEKWIALFFIMVNSFSMLLASFSGGSPTWLWRRPWGGSQIQMLYFKKDPLHKAQELMSCLGLLTTTCLHPCCTCFICILKFCYIFIMWKKQESVKVVKTSEIKC